MNTLEVVHCICNRYFSQQISDDKFIVLVLFLRSLATTELLLRSNSVTERDNPKANIGSLVEGISNAIRTSH